MELSNLKPNKNNPRRISEQKLEQLKKSIESFEKMLEARPIIVNKDFKILGGNMRYTALLDLGYDTIPDHWVKIVEFTKEEEREFIIKDNLGYGEWDWDMLHIEWKAEELKEWGMDMPDWAAGHEYNLMTEYDLDLEEEFDPIGITESQQRVVFIFDGKDEAESYLNTLNVEYKKMNMAWQVNLTSQSTL
jgi:hypothetical protein